LAEGYVEVKALGRRRVVYTLGWNYHAFGRTALLLNRVDEARQNGIAAHRFDEIGEANYRKALALAEPRYALAAWMTASAAWAAAARISGSSRVPTTASIPRAFRSAIFSSDRTNPVTAWPAAMSFSATEPPI
jgi:hypothetical protein